MRVSGQQRALINLIITAGPLALALILALVFKLTGSIPTAAVLAPGMIGIALLASAKWSSFKRGDLATFGFKNLNKAERLKYFSAYFFIVLSVGVGLFSLWFSHNTGESETPEAFGERMQRQRCIPIMEEGKVSGFQCGDQRLPYKPENAPSPIPTSLDQRVAPAEPSSDK